MFRLWKWFVISQTATKQYFWCTDDFETRIQEISCIRHKKKETIEVNIRYVECINYKFKALFAFYKLINYFQVYCQFLQVKFYDPFYCEPRTTMHLKCLNVGHEGKTRMYCKKCLQMDSITISLILLTNNEILFTIIEICLLGCPKATKTLIQKSEF